MAGYRTGEPFMAAQLRKTRTRCAYYRRVLITILDELTPKLSHGQVEKKSNLETDKPGQGLASPYFNLSNLVFAPDRSWRMNRLSKALATPRPSAESTPKACRMPGIVGAWPIMRTVCPACC